MSEGENGSVFNLTKKATILTGKIGGGGDELSLEID